MALTTKQIEARIAFVNEEIANADSRIRATHGDRGPVEFAKARKQFIEGGETRLAMLERALGAAARQDLQKREQVLEQKEAKMAVCPTCFCAHPGEC